MIVYFYSASLLCKFTLGVWFIEYPPPVRDYTSCNSPSCSQCAATFACYRLCSIYTL